MSAGEESVLDSREERERLKGNREVRFTEVRKLSGKSKNFETKKGDQENMEKRGQDSESNHNCNRK